MNTVYLVFQYGQEDPICVCSSEEVAKEAISYSDAKDVLELGRLVDTWYEPIKVLSNTQEVKEYFY